MKLVMENKSGYIRPLCALHIQYPHRQPWDVSWPIENQLYLPNKEAVAKSYDEWKRREDGRLLLDGELLKEIVFCLSEAKLEFLNSADYSIKLNCSC